MGTHSLSTVLGRYAHSAREINLVIQQCEHALIRRGPRVVWHNWRMLYDAFDSDTSAEDSSGSGSGARTLLEKCVCLFSVSYPLSGEDTRRGSSEELDRLLVCFL